MHGSAGLLGGVAVVRGNSFFGLNLCAQRETECVCVCKKQRKKKRDSSSTEKIPRQIQLAIGQKKKKNRERKRERSRPRNEGAERVLCRRHWNWQYHSVSFLLRLKTVAVSACLLAGKTNKIPKS